MQLILETKLYQPRLASDTVPRPRLNAELDHALDEGRVTLVVAPAGYGKTTAVAAWLAGLAVAGADSPSVAWYSIDEGDNDLRLFLGSLTTAIDMAAPGLLAGSLPLAERLPLPPTAELVAALVRAIVRLPRTLIVVLDDYQAICTEAVHQFVAQLARYRPPNLHLVLTARADPPLPLVQWRAAGQLCELRAAQLAFSPEEGATLIGRVAGETVSPAARQALYTQVEGWSVGLRLAALSLRTAADPQGFLAEFGARSDRPIIDYLADEVLNRLPPQTHRYLLTTAILGRLQKELCAAVMDTDDVDGCQVALEFMERQNLFVVPLDARHEWYRYHHQFQAMLQQRARAQMSREELAALHRRAAAWYAAHGFLDDALSHAAAAGDTAAMLDLVETAAPELENEDEWDRLGQLLQRLPQDALRERPALLMALAWHQMLRADLAGLDTLLEQAATLLRRESAAVAPELLAEAWGELHALWSSSYFRQQSAEVQRDHSLAALAAVPAHRHWVRGYAFSTWVYAAFTPDDIAALQHRLLAELETAPQLSRPYEVRLLQVLGFSQFRAGALADLEATCRRYADLAARHGMPANWAYGQFNLGIARFYAGEPGAREYLEKVLQQPHLVGSEVLLSAVYPLISLYHEAGEPERVAALLTRVAGLLPGEANREEPAALGAFDRLLAGDLAAAVDWADNAAHTPATFPYEARALVLARVRLAEGRAAGIAQAAAALDGYLTALVATGEQRHRIHALVLRAQLHWERGATGLALDRLAEAIAMGYGRGYRRWYVEQGAVMGEMLHALARSGRLVEESGALLALLATAGAARPALRGNAAGRMEAITPLSEREIDILEYLASGLSNKEIAQKLRISPLTVRNHASSLYGKLGVRTRRQAVARARALGLLRAGE